MGWQAAKGYGEELGRSATSVKVTANKLTALVGTVASIYAGWKFGVAWGVACAFAATTIVQALAGYRMQARIDELTATPPEPPPQPNRDPASRIRAIDQLNHSGFLIRNDVLSRGHTGGPFFTKPATDAAINNWFRDAETELTPDELVEWQALVPIGAGDQLAGLWQAREGYLQRLAERLRNTPPT